MDNSEKLRILIVEDDPDASDNLCDILELHGHVVRTAGTAAEALDCTELSSFSVILLDWNLPDASALGLLPQLNVASPEAEIIIVTGHGEFEIAVAALREGAADYLLKPINPQALEVSLQRVAQRRRLAREKRQSDEMFRHLVETAPCLIAILRVDGSIAYFSTYAADLTGYAAAEVLRKDFFKLLQPDADPAVASHKLQRIFAGDPMRGYETLIRCRDGTHRWVVWNGHKLNDFERAPAALLVGQDITEHKRTVEQLIQSERLAAIGEAMTGLIHESRNALQRSQSSLDLLAIRVKDRPEAVKYLNRIQIAQEDLHQLYEEVRQYAAPIRLQTEKCHPSDVFAEAWNLMEHARADRVVRFVCRPGPRDAVCRLDRFAVRRVFRNILENSLAACHDPVEIRYDFQCLLDEDNPQVQLSIRDNGPGLTDEQKQRIFEPFFTTKTHGTGLGMTLCQRIVEAHDGTIGLGSGNGTEIIITFPCEESNDGDAASDQQ